MTYCASSARAIATCCYALVPCAFTLLASQLVRCFQGRPGRPGRSDTRRLAWIAPCRVHARLMRLMLLMTGLKQAAPLCLCTSSRTLLEADSRRCCRRAYRRPVSRAGIWGSSSRVFALCARALMPRVHVQAMVVAKGPAQYAEPTTDFLDGGSTQPELSRSVMQWQVEMLFKHLCCDHDLAGFARVLATLAPRVDDIPALAGRLGRTFHRAHVVSGSFQAGVAQLARRPGFYG